MGHEFVTSPLLQYLSLVVLMVLALLFHQNLAHIADWGETIPFEEIGTKDQMKVTRLHFYLHSMLSGNDPTVALVAQPPSIHPSKMNFGLLGMVDDPLTRGPKLTSKLVGRFQGLVGYAGQEERVLIAAASFVFTDDKFSGSSLSILTRIPQMNPVREYAIVGGTGLFRFARGFAVARTYWSNDTTQDSIIEYDVTVVHKDYDSQLMFSY